MSSTVVVSRNYLELTAGLCFCIRVGSHVPVIGCAAKRAVRARHLICCILVFHHPGSGSQVGFYSDPAKGWIEGVAILCAVLVVAIVTATNDYSKDKQFRALNAVKEDVTVQASVIPVWCTSSTLISAIVCLREIGGASDGGSGREAGAMVAFVCKRMWDEKTRLGRNGTRG